MPCRLKTFESGPNTTFTFLLASLLLPLFGMLVDSSACKSGKIWYFGHFGGRGGIFGNQLGSQDCLDIFLLRTWTFWAERILFFVREYSSITQILNVMPQRRDLIRAVHDPYFTNDPIFRSCSLKRESTWILGFAVIWKFVCAEMFSIYVGCN